MRRKDIQREVDEELFIYEQRILELKTRRNAYTVISMLPPELLVDIFLLVQADRPLEQWHHITHVCRHWRDTAINTPILWTKPPTRNQNYTTSMLERSRTANLNIILEPQASTVAITAASSHIRRIQALTMILSTDRLADACDRLSASGHPFPRLESLHIEAPRVRNSSTNWILPSTIMGSSTSMRSLYLKGITFDWQSLAPLNLTSLCLVSIRLAEQISTETLLHTLSQMPCLRQLAFPLADIILPHNTPAIDTTKVALPHLQCLDVSDCNPQRLTSFLSFLSLPKLHCLKIDPSTTRAGESDSSYALPAIATTLANGNFQRGGKLLVKRDYISISAMDEVPFVTISLPYTMNFDHSNSRTQQLLRIIAPIFPSLVQVTIHEVALNSSELVQIFGNMHQLKAVTVYDDSTLVSALPGALAHCSDRGAPTFSSLDTIGCDDWDEIDPSVTVGFCNALLQRSNHTTAIKTLYYFDNPPPQWATDLLKNGGICVEKGDVPNTYGF